MVAERVYTCLMYSSSCSLAKISMVAELGGIRMAQERGCSLAKISMVAERRLPQ